MNCDASWPFVSIVIPAYGRQQLLEKAVRSLFALDYPHDSYEVIVVDSSPDSENVEFVESLESVAPCRLRVFHKSPEGPGPSRNLGAAHARGKLIAFMDSDCQATPQWLRESIASFAPGVGLVQGKTLPDPKASLGVLTHYPMNEAESFVYECTNIIYDKTAFNEAGGFAADATPEALQPLGGEDVILAWTVKRNGWKSAFAADSVVYHAVIAVSLRRWITPWRLTIWPKLAKEFPELREYFFCRYFWNPDQAMVCGFLIGLMSSFATSGVSAVLCLPYLAHRGLRPSKSFPGLLRPLRILPYLARDTVSLGLLAFGSIRYRSLLL